MHQFILVLCRGALIGHPVENLRVVLTDGASHAVDSSELAFKLAALYAFRQVQSCHYLVYISKIGIIAMLILLLVKSFSFHSPKWVSCILCSCASVLCGSKACYFRAGHACGTQGSCRVPGWNYW